MFPTPEGPEWVLEEDSVKGCAVAERVRVTPRETWPFFRSHALKEMPNTARHAPLVTLDPAAEARESRSVLANASLNTGLPVAAKLTLVVSLSVVFCVFSALALAQQARPGIDPVLKEGVIVES